MILAPAIVAPLTEGKPRASGDDPYVTIPPSGEIA